jgi:hypothetical protein
MPGISELHVLYGVKIDSTVIGGILAQNIGLKTELRKDAADGSPIATHLAIASQEASAGFDTRAIVAALTACGAMGVSIASLTAKLTFYAQKVLAGGTRTSGSAHRSYAINAGVLFPTKLSIQHGQDAVLSYAVIPTWNGTNNPIVLAETVSLPTGASETERFSLGPVTVGAVVYDQLSGVDIDFGAQVKAESADGEYWSRFAWIESYAPRIVLRGRKVTWFKDTAGIPMLGAVHTHANTTIFLRKRAAGGTFVADATAQHVKFTAAGIATIDEPGTFRGIGPGETTMALDLYYDGANHPIVTSLASAIA